MISNRPCRHDFLVDPCPHGARTRFLPTCVPKLGPANMSPVVGVRSHDPLVGPHFISFDNETYMSPILMEFSWSFILLVSGIRTCSFC